MVKLVDILEANDGRRRRRRDDSRSLRAPPHRGWVLYYTADTQVGDMHFKKNQVVEGPFLQWSEDDAKAALKEYDSESRKNLTYGYKEVNNGFVV